MTEESSPAVAGGGAWAGRPNGLPAAVPPPSVPLTFLTLAGLGLVACGIAWVWASTAAASDPTSDPAVSAVHFGVLTTLAMGILGATHQFTPVITGRPLRSTRMARVTCLSWLAAAWMLPLGIATGALAVTASSGAMAGLAVILAALNLTPALLVRGKGAPVAALRLAAGGAVLTAFLGVAFVGDRQADWFHLSGHVDVAMGVLGLFTWLGMTYVGVAEKLWPMFMLAHVPGRRVLGRVAVAGVGLGSVVLAPGIAWSITPLAAVGAGLLAAGLGGHLASLAAHVRHRRRKADLHLLFVVTAAAWLPVGAGLCIAGTAVLGHDHHLGVALIGAGLLAAGGWLLEALVGHSHKVVPFIAWSALRARGLKEGPTGRPLMFADLYGQKTAKATYSAVTLGLVLLCAGLASSAASATAAGGGLLAVAGVMVTLNLSLTPLRMLRASEPPSHRAAPSRKSTATKEVTPAGPF